MGLHSYCEFYPSKFTSNMILTVSQDDADIDDTWSNPGKVADVLKILEGWDPRCRAIVRPAWTHAFIFSF